MKEWFRFYFKYSDGEFEFNIGWFWIFLIITLVYWGIWG